MSAQRNDVDDTVHNCHGQGIECTSAEVYNTTDQLDLTTTTEIDNDNPESLIEDLRGLDSHAIEVVRPGGYIDDINNLPEELDVIVNQNYNDHSMMARAKNGIIK